MVNMVHQSREHDNIQVACLQRFSFPMHRLASPAASAWYYVCQLGKSVAGPDNAVPAKTQRRMGYISQLHDRISESWSIDMLGPNCTQ